MAGENFTLAVDAGSCEIIAHSLTDQKTGDAPRLEPLLHQIYDENRQLTADEAYDGTPAYDAVLCHSAGATVVIQQCSNAVEDPMPNRTTRETITQHPCR